MRWLIPVSVLWFLIAIVLACPAMADGQTSAYRSTIDEAVAEFDAGHFEESRALFTRAHAIQPNARTLRGIGMAEFELRNYVASVAALEEALASSDRRLEGSLRAETVRLLERAQAFVTRIIFDVSPDDALVMIDGTAVNAHERSLILPVGEHVVEVQREGYETARRELSLKSGGVERLALALHPAQHVSTSEGNGPTSSPSAPQPADGHPGSRRGAWALTAASGVLLVGGIVLMAVGLNDVSKVEDAETGTRWSEVEQANTRAPILTGTGIALSAVGVAGLVSGLVWGLRKRPQAEPDAHSRLRLFAAGRF